MYSQRILPALHGLRLLALSVFVLLSFVIGQKAFAADTLSSSAYIDANGNGTVDNIKLTFDENIDQCTYEAGDWTVNTAGSINVAITGINTSDPEGNGQGDCNGSDAVIYLSVTADTSETGGATAPVVSYANAGTAGSLSGVTTAQISAKANATISDTAGPVLVSVSPTVSATGVSKNADYVLTYSEAMDTTFAEGTEFAVTPDPGSFSVAWTVSNTVVTITTPPLLCNTTYAMDADSNEVDASAGTPTNFVLTGPVDGTWSFTTGTCTSSATSSSSPQNVAVTYAGPSCGTANVHSFTASGDNISEYIVSDNQYFIGTEWTTYSATSSISATFAEGTQKAYLLFRSDSGNLSNAFEVTLNSWAQTCGGDSDDEPAEEPDEDEEVPVDEEGGVTPVPGVSPGDVIRSASSSSVYYVTENYGRRVFVNQAVYFTWFSSFAPVKTVSDSTLSALPIEGLMLPKAGVVLVKIQSSAKVYVLGSSGDAFAPLLREIVNEQTAVTNFGLAWADYIIDIEPTFFARFGTGSAVAADEDFDRSIMKRRVDLK